jgi:hypothetical protein
LHDWKGGASLNEERAHVDRIEAWYATGSDHKARTNSRRLRFGVCRIDGANQRTRSPRAKEGGDNAFVVASDDSDAIAWANPVAGEVGVRVLDAPAQVCPRPDAAPILHRG